MTKKYQLLLHIGLPKTATTSFQFNVLYPLHKQGKINFLGALVSNSFDLKFYPLLKYRNEIMSSLSQAELVNMRGGLKHY